MAAAFALGAQRQQWRLRVLHVPLSCMDGWENVLIALQRLWTLAGEWCHDNLSLAHVPSMFFLALYGHRHLSLPCVCEVGEECNLMSQLVKGFLLPIAAAAPNAKANLTPCRQHGLGRRSSGSGEHH